MKAYQVSWTESVKYFIQVMAENKEEAQVKAFEEYDHGWDNKSASARVDEDSIRVYEF